MLHQPPPTEWVPITDEIYRSLEGQYLRWIIDLTEIRERMAKLREAFHAGWKPDEISQSNLDRLNTCDEWNAYHNMDNARTILTCAEHFAAPYMPGTPEDRNEYFLTAVRLAAEKSRPSAQEMAEFRRGMLEGRIPWPQGSERQMLRAILKDMLQTKKALH